VKEESYELELLLSIALLKNEHLVAPKPFIKPSPTRQRVYLAIFMWILVITVHTGDLVVCQLVDCRIAWRPASYSWMAPISAAMRKVFE
jgi:hypothetical protein